LEKAAVNKEAPFLPMVSKSQKKKLAKLNKVAGCKTRSQGPLPTSQ